MSAPFPSVVLDDIASLDADIARDGFAIRRPNNLLALCEAARAEYLTAFEASTLQPPKLKFSYLDLGRAPWRKLAIGSQNGVGEVYAQVLQTIYFDCNASPYRALNAIFHFMNRLRNGMMKVAADFGDNPVNDKFWNACRVHHYPRGGGFMATHRDTYFPIKLADLPYYQIMVPLSVMGRDFVQGGGILFSRQGEKLNTDEIAGMGSVVVFDGRIRHGVEDVDPHALMNFNDRLGRLAAFSNLYVTPDASG